MINELNTARKSLENLLQYIFIDGWKYLSLLAFQFFFITTEIADVTLFHDHADFQTGLDFLKTIQ